MESIRPTLSGYSTAEVRLHIPPAADRRKNEPCLQLVSTKVHTIFTKQYSTALKKKQYFGHWFILTGGYV